MDALVLRIKEPELCYVFARNARRNGKEELALQAFRRAVDLRAENWGAQTEAEFYAVRAIYAYEEALNFNRARRVRANGTWRTVKHQGVLAAVSRRLDDPEEQQMLPVLTAMGMPDYSFQALAADFPDLFKTQAA